AGQLHRHRVLAAALGGQQRVDAVQVQVPLPGPAPGEPVAEGAVGDDRAAAGVQQHGAEFRVLGGGLLTAEVGGGEELSGRVRSRRALVEHDQERQVGVPLDVVLEV